MAETTIQITVTGENAAETIERITEQIPEGAKLVSQAESGPTGEELFQAAMAASGDLSGMVTDWFTGFSEATGFSFFAALLICLGIIAASWGIERLVAGTILVRRNSVDTQSADGFGRTVLACKQGITIILRLLFFVLLVRAGLALILPAGGEAAELGIVLLRTIVLIRAWYAIIDLLAAPSAPARRPTGLDDTEAALIMRVTMLSLCMIAGMDVMREFVMSVVDAGEAGVIFAIATRVVSGLTIALFLIAIRKPVGKLILLAFARDPANPGAVVRQVARFWPAIYILLQVLQFLAETRGYLAGIYGQEAAALKRSFGALILAPFVVAGLREWTKHFLANAQSSLGRKLMGVFSLLEGAVIVGTGVFILYAWDIDPFATDLTGAKRVLPGLISAAIIAVIGISLWRTAKAVLTDGRQPGEDGGPPEEEGGKGGSRIETVMPILRAVTAAFIGVVTVLLVLSSLGVQIAPLLAGAGILGIAIGFGAQRVVEDVISGVLYLVEDAFRKGEFIETAQGKGIVEAIMLRSVRLRHHLGAVYTIPFSAMGTIQNHSRDWVTVKLRFEVGPDQDLEKVRKLVKKVGQELLEDPELEDQFLAPLKSQGAVALVGSNYQIGVKFTSEPGKQFLIRRKALNAIQKAFLENNIEMAAPRVIVEGPEQAAAAAAKTVQDAQAAAAKP